MKKIRRAVSRTLLGGAFALSATACSDKFLKVTNPNVVDAATVDPTTSAGTLANSVQQNFATAYGVFIMYGAWFTGEANVADTFPTRNEFGYRVISDFNGSLNNELWQPLQVAAASSKIVLDLALPNPTTNINLARAATFRGFSVLTMASDFCTGALSSGPELTTAQMLDTAIVWFGQGIAVGNANGTTDGKALANASLVGRARAKLQKGDKAGAAADAANVPAGFNFNLNYTDDLANRTRLSNIPYVYTFDRSSISIAAAYQIDNDPRVQWLPPSQHKLQAQDAVPGGFFMQKKYTAYNSPVRLASKLEADYIAAEAGTTADQLALITARRTANNQPAYTGGTDAASVLTELFDQRAREFWLEDRRLADYRRHPEATNYIPAPSTPYLKPGYVSIGTQTCYPLPRAERDNNPNMRKS